MVQSTSIRAKQAAQTVSTASELVSKGGVHSKVLDAALALGTAKESATTPTPVVRGPQQSVPATMEALTPDEEKRAEKAFNKHDKAKTGEVDLIEFYKICDTLEIPVEHDIAKEWLTGKSESKGLRIDDFKELYGRILAAQTPAVRKICAQVPPKLSEVNGTESHMRAAFNACANGGLLNSDGLREVLKNQSFPDYYGDGFEHFVYEWLRLVNKDDNSAVNFHEFAECVNFLIEFCSTHHVGS